MGTVRTNEFRKDAVWIVLSSKDQKMIRGIIFPEDGLSRKQIAADLGVGMSTLNNWVTAHRDTDVMSHEDRELALVNRPGFTGGQNHQIVLQRPQVYTSDSQMSHSGRHGRPEQMILRIRHLSDPPG